MANFSATEAAFEGFRLARHNPRAIGMWALAALVFNAAVLIVLIQVAGPAMTEMAAMSRAGAAPDDPAAIAASLSLALGYLATLPLMILFCAVFAGATYRASTQPEAKAFGFVRLGSDELRLAAVTVAVGLIGTVALFAVTFAIVMLATFIAMAITGGEPNMGIMFLIVILLYVIMFFGGMAVYVKFSFAGPMTFLKKRIDVFGSWKATAGKFWPLFGCYTLAIILGVVVTLLGASIGVAALIGFGGQLAQVLNPDMSSLAAYFTLPMIAYVVVNSIFAGLTAVIYQGPAIAAYKALHGGPDAITRAFD